MAMKKYRKIAGVRGVDASSTAIIDLPLVHEYLALYLVMTGMALADLGECRVILNDVVIQRFTMAEHDAITKALSLGGDLGAGTETVIWFGLPHLIEKEREASGIGTQSTKTFQVKSLAVEIDIGAGAVAPTLKVQALVNPNSPPGAILKIDRYPVVFAGAGTQDIDKIKTNSGDDVLALVLHHDAGELTSLEVEADGKIIHEGTKDFLDLVATVPIGGRPRAPSTTCTVVDFCLSGDTRDALETIPERLNDMRVRPTMSAAGTVVLSVLSSQVVDGELKRKINAGRAFQVQQAKAAKNAALA